MLLLLALSISSCANDSEDDFIEIVQGSEDPTATINYTDDIAPIIQNACVGCHNSPPVNGAPSSYTNYQQVSQGATRIFNRMSLQSGSPGAMPPSGRLPQATIDKIQEWIDEGLPED